MPGDSSEKFDRFLRRLRRRGWVLRAGESAGIGLLVAAVGGVAMVAIVAGRHPSAESAVIALLAMGAVGGGAIGLIRRPGVLRVAEEADRQLHLPELLSSAAMLPVAGARDGLDRALRRTLAERAAAVCLGKTARRIRLRRFGVRGWGAIVLSAGAPVLLATLISPAAPSPTAAADSGQAVAEADGGDAPLVQFADTAAGPRQEMNPDEPVRSGPIPGDYGPATSPPNPTPSTANGGHIAPSLPNVSSVNAAGAGNAHTDVNQPLASHSTGPTSVQVPSPATGSAPAGGVGPASITPPGPGSGNTAGGTGRTVDSDRPPPWQTAGWPAEAAAARRQVDAGQVPAAYVDLVRDYFSRDND